jgi:hypothetical protein
MLQRGGGAGGEIAARSRQPPRAEHIKRRSIGSGSHCGRRKASLVLRRRTRAAAALTSFSWRIIWRDRTPI